MKYTSTILCALVCVSCVAAAVHPGVIQMSMVNHHEVKTKVKTENLIGRPDGHENRQRYFIRPDVYKKRQPLFGRPDGHENRQHPFGRPDEHNLYDFVFQYHFNWAEFKQTYQKKYKTFSEEMKRFNIFIKNLAKINSHNALFEAGKKSYTMGINAFSDLTHDEFMKSRTGGSSCFMGKNKAPRVGSTFIPPAVKDLPKSVDWREKGAVTPVKDQGQCGSCWSFSTTGAVEGQHFRKTGKLVSFSESQLVDCSAKYGNQGCNGGLMDNGFQYIKDFGIETEASYSYKPVERNCNYNKKLVAGNVTGFVDIKQGSEADLMSAIALHGPVSVAIDASHESFQTYSSGVYDEEACSSENLDHGVLAVGYGTTSDGTDYWIVKNSWNTHWGDNGYILMSRNKKNQCGIASSASYPLV